MYKHTYIVSQYETGLLFKEGKLAETLPAGKHVRWGRHFELVRFDLRAQSLALMSQEITSADGVSVRVSAGATFRIVDAAKLFLGVADWYGTFYVMAHVALRDVVSSRTAEAALAGRAEMAAEMASRLQESASPLGLLVESAAIRDIGVSGEIKRAFGQLAIAQKEAQAALERARAETATLRALANAAKMAQDHPQLLQLRLLRVLEQSKSAKVGVSAQEAFGASFGFEL